MESQLGLEGYQGIAFKYLYTAGWLDELCDGYFVLLKPPLDQLGAADVDRTEDMPGVVLHKGAAVNDQHAFGPTPQEAGKLLGIHHFAWKSVPGHSRLDLVAVSGRKGGMPGAREASSDLPQAKGLGEGEEAAPKQPNFATVLRPCMASHGAKPVGKDRDREKERE